MRRSTVALLIIMVAIFGYFSMASVAILMRDAPEESFQDPENFDKPTTPPAVTPNNATGEPAATSAQK